MICTGTKCRTNASSILDDSIGVAGFSAINPVVPFSDSA